MTTATRTRIELLRGCSDASCLEMAARLSSQLDPNYSRGAAVMDIDGSFGAYSRNHRTMRKRADRAERLGYTFAQIDRTQYVDDIYRINTSKAQRQGRPMTAGYNKVPTFSPNPKVCSHHHVYTYGVLHDDQLVAYLWLYRSGDLAMVSSILGHAEHLDNNVMYLLYEGMLADQWPLGGTVFYNLWNSGQDGLRFFKTRVGLAAADVEWSL